MSRHGRRSHGDIGYAGDVLDIPAERISEDLDELLRSRDSGPSDNNVSRSLRRPADL